MSNTSSQQTVLGSWKEIAAYLGKGVRTVQRWEQQFGLPVRRPNGELVRVVHAFPEELDRWLANQWSVRPKSDPLAPNLRAQIASFAEHCERSHELVRTNRELREEFRRNLEALVCACRRLTQQLSDQHEVDVRTTLELRTRSLRRDDAPKADTCLHERTVILAK